MKIKPADLDKRGKHELMMSAIVPRPIAWVSTVGEDGIFNLAPFSAFSSLGQQPSLVCLSISLKRGGEEKDTLRNIRFSKDFVVNVVNEDLAEAMNKSSFEYPIDVDEFKEAGVTPAKADLVKSPMVAESPVNMECKLAQVLKLGEAGYAVIGEVLLVHVKDELWNGEYIEPSLLKAVGRVGGIHSYCRTTDTFEMERPDPSSWASETPGKK
ncbi:flavin reductase family protein [Chloroflexota bacterium]